MRIRISSDFEQSNLPQIRSWFNVDRENTIASLKLSLCASVPALRDARVRSNELVLTLDDFALLDDSAIDILRDGDLICLRRPHLPKRRTEVLDDAPRKRHKPLSDSAAGRAAVKGEDRNIRFPQIPGPFDKGNLTASSSSTSGSTSSDDASSNSSSISSSGSSSDSDSDTTSSSSSGLSHCPPRPPPLSAPQRKPSQPAPVPVPPGLGKSQTQSRNERRRRKRLAQREGNDTPPTPAGGSNAIALGATKSVHAPEPMMMSLRNKNKRRGFKNATTLPPRITFQDSEAAQGPRPMQVPPSERDQLPPRLFVTSVDVEAGAWPRDHEQVWDRKRKEMQRDSYGQEDEADFTLDYGGTPEGDNTAVASVPDYTALEQAWVDAPPLVKNSTLSIGCVIGWQELGINPTTLTPETMLFLARVVSGGENGAIVVRLHRPGSGTVSFAGGDLKDEEEEEEFSWERILDTHWRLVSN